MNKAIKACFPYAEQVIDRFHVQKLAFDALQEIRIKHRWEAIDAEVNDIQNTKQSKTPYRAEILPKGDTRRQLLARRRYLLFKSPNNWTASQRNRAEILIELYPDIKKTFPQTTKTQKESNLYQLLSFLLSDQPGITCDPARIVSFLPNHAYNYLIISVINLLFLAVF